MTTNTNELTGRALPQPNLPPGFKVDGMMPCGMWRVQTPLELPDGSLVDVFWGKSNDGAFFVSDLGEAENWVCLLGKRTRRKKACVEACEADLVDGEIVRTVDPVEGDVVAIFCVAMAVYCMCRDTIEESTDAN